jgi:hypothetical protein
MPGNSLPEAIEKSRQGPQPGAELPSKFSDSGGTGRRTRTPQNAQDAADSMARWPSLPMQRTDESTSPAPIAKYVSRRKFAIFREDFAFFRFEFRIRMFSPKSGDPYR